MAYDFDHVLIRSKDPQSRRSSRAALLVFAMVLLALTVVAQEPGETDADRIAGQTDADRARGEKLFEAHCARCHSVGGTGGEAGIRGFIDAYAAATGEPLWRFQTGGAARANPISFLIDGKQRVATAAGNALFVFGLD